MYKRDFNTFEKDFALYLEGQKTIHWWHRIAVRQEYTLQDWRRQRVYPDFVVRVQLTKKSQSGQLFVIETKGSHLQGNEDTKYKEGLLKIPGKAYQSAYEVGEMNTSDPKAKYTVLLQDNWKADLNVMIDSDNDD